MSFCESLFRNTVGSTVAALALFSTPAQAELALTGVDCNSQGTDMTSLPGYVDCSGAWFGNNTNQAADVASQIFGDWDLSDLEAHNVTENNTSATGTLSFAAQSGKFVLALKAGNAFSLYLFDGEQGAISSVDYDTLGVGFISSSRKNQQVHFGQGLSHATIYVASTTVAGIPEPETYALMFAGLGMLGFVARRRSQNWEGPSESSRVTQVV